MKYSYSIMTKRQSLQRETSQAQTELDHSPLKTICGQTECVGLLAGTGKVDWNVRDISGKTPLHWALYKGHSNTIKLIVKFPGIDFSVKPEKGETLDSCPMCC